MKQKIIKKIEKIIAENELSYFQASNYFRTAMKNLNLKRPKKKPVSPIVPTNTEIKKFLQIVDKKDSKDKLMMKILLFMGLRSFELVNLKINNLDFTSGKQVMKIKRKGGAEKVMPIPTVLSDELKLYVSELKNREYVFESKFRKPFTTRSIRQKFQIYRREAGISESVKPHSFRKKLLTTLAEEGWNIPAIQNISGHENAGSLKHYIEKNPETVREAYNKATSKLAGEVN